MLLLLFQQHPKDEKHTTDNGGHAWPMTKVPGQNFESNQHKPCCSCCLQVVGSIAAAVVMCMALSAGTAVHHQIQQSVYVDSIMPHSSMDVSSAAKKLNGLLYVGPTCLIDSKGSSVSLK
jgi:hypothetical protein